GVYPRCRAPPRLKNCWQGPPPPRSLRLVFRDLSRRAYRHASLVFGRSCCGAEACSVPSSTFLEKLGAEHALREQNRAHLAAVEGNACRRFHRRGCRVRVGHFVDDNTGEAQVTGGTLSPPDPPPITLLPLAPP